MTAAVAGGQAGEPASGAPAARAAGPTPPASPAQDPCSTSRKGPGGSEAMEPTAAQVRTEADSAPPDEAMAAAVAAAVEDEVRRTCRF